MFRLVGIQIGNRLLIPVNTGHLIHRLISNVVTGRKMRPVGVEHDDFYLLLLGGLHPDRIQLPEQIQILRIALLYAIEGDNTDIVAYFKKDFRFIRHNLFQCHCVVVV